MTTRLTQIGPLQRRGIRAGIYSICSSGAVVLETAMAHAACHSIDMVVESTCNQVNQYGGYANMTPADFAAYVRGLSVQAGLPDDRLLIGGDHLGPYPWRHEKAQIAMGKAEKLVSDCISAGYGKIHLDCGMPLGDDPADSNFIPPELSADRTVRLCRAAEAARTGRQRKQGLPLYVIGAEAPTPGGSLKGPIAVPVTEPSEIAAFMDICRQKFEAAGIDDAWQRIAAVVVQPGIDFGPDSCMPYNPDRARALSQFHDSLPGIMTYEVHSTDFQGRKALSTLVDDHFALLKTGPVLTFAFREAVFALAHIENELLKGEKTADPSEIIGVIEGEMAASGEYWRSHVPEDIADPRIYMIYGLTDRIRYFWNTPPVRTAFEKLISNLDRPIPLGLTSQYLPEAFEDIMNGRLSAKPLPLIRHRILKALAPYVTACHGKDSFGP